jgi:26S proteasome regulatory subunit N1
LKEKLELCVERLTDKEAGLRQQAVDMIKTEVSGATSSMTSVPKPLKFMTPLYTKLTDCYKAYKTNDDFKVSSFTQTFINHILILQKQLSDLCSVIGMVAAPDDSTDMIDYCMKGTLTKLESWGHEYLRALAG